MEIDDVSRSIPESGPEAMFEICDPEERDYRAYKADFVGPALPEGVCEPVEKLPFILIIAVCYKAVGTRLIQWFAGI